MLRTGVALLLTAFLVTIPVSAAGQTSLANAAADAVAAMPATAVASLTQIQIRVDTRPSVLPALYVSVAALQGYDAYSTLRAVKQGAVEVNPMLPRGSRKSGCVHRRQRCGDVRVNLRGGAPVARRSSSGRDRPDGGDHWHDGRHRCAQRVKSESHPLRQPSLPFGELRLGKPANRSLVSVPSNARPRHPRNQASHGVTSSVPFCVCSRMS